MTEFEVAETFNINASVNEDDIFYESDCVLIEVHISNVTHVGRSSGDVVVTMLASPDLIENISSDHLDISHAFPACSPPYPPPKCHNLSSVDFHDMLMGDVFDCVESLGTFRGCDPSQTHIACT